MRRPEGLRARGAPGPKQQSRRRLAPRAGLACSTLKPRDLWRLGFLHLPPPAAEALMGGNLGGAEIDTTAGWVAATPPAGTSWPGAGPRPSSPGGPPVGAPAGRRQRPTARPAGSRQSVCEASGRSMLLHRAPHGPLRTTALPLPGPSGRRRTAPGRRKRRKGPSARR